MPGEFNDIFWLSTASTAGDKAVSQVDGLGWVRHDSHLAFKLTGTAIPEPSTILLLGTGLLGIVGITRRRKD